MKKGMATIWVVVITALVVIIISGAGYYLTEKQNDSAKKDLENRITALENDLQEQKDLAASTADVTTGNSVSTGTAATTAITNTDKAAAKKTVTDYLNIFADDSRTENFVTGTAVRALRTAKLNNYLDCLVALSSKYPDELIMNADIVLGLQDTAKVTSIGNATTSGSKLEVVAVLYSTHNVTLTLVKDGGSWKIDYSSELDTYKSNDHPHSSECSINK